MVWFWGSSFCVGSGSFFWISLLQISPWKSGFLFVDSLGFFFLLLSMLILASINILGKDLLFFLVLVPSTVCFCVSEVFAFFLLFEAVVFPMGLYIATGKTGERTAAVWFFFLYTLLLSIPFFVGLTLLLSVGTVGGFPLFSKFSSYWVAGVLMAMLMVKFPVFVFHGWLPRAHVEAPTLGSVLLASILLKLGSYAMLRLVNWFLFSFASWGVLLGVTGSVVSACLCFLQSDFKALIAMSSVAHMSALWGAFSTSQGVGSDANVLVSVSHGFIAAGLFFFVGQMYEHRGSRSLLVLRDTPSMTLVPFFLWCTVCFCNAGLPPFLSFFSEMTSFQSLLTSCLLVVSLLLLYGVLAGFFCFSMFDFSSMEKKSEIGKTSGSDFCSSILFSLLLWNFFLLVVL